MTKTNTTLEQWLWVFTFSRRLGNVSPRPFGKEWDGRASACNDMQEIESMMLLVIAAHVQRIREITRTDL
jgi:hypothetical protein